MNRRFGKNDVIFISFLAVFCIAVCLWVYKGGAVEGSNIKITVDGKEYPLGYSLFEDCYELEANTEVRRAAFRSFYGTLEKYKMLDMLKEGMGDFRAFDAERRFFVSPKECDLIAIASSYLISSALNKTFDTE